MLALFSFPRPPPTQLYPLSLQDALPILQLTQRFLDAGPGRPGRILVGPRAPAPDGDLGPCGGVDLDLSPGKPMEPLDRKSTRLNSSHVRISYAVFCLKKKKTQENIDHNT